MKTKKLFAALLAVIMLLSLFPLSSFAGEVGEQDAGKNGNIKWFFSSNTLFIYGEDEMTDFYVNFDDVTTTSP